MGRKELRHGDVLPPGDVRRAGDQQRQREHGQRERGGVEDVRLATIPGPPDQRLGGEPDGEHQELQIEPVRCEPEKQVRAEDDGERTEAKRESLRSRPGQEGIECVREQQLRDDERGVVVDRPPVPSPVHEDRQVRARLHVVLRSKRDIENESASRAGRSASGGPREERGPREEDRAGRQTRPEQSVVRVNGRIRGTRYQRGRADDRHEEGAS